METSFRHFEPKDMLMYQDELNREALLIARGYQAIAQDVATFWSRFVTLLGFRG